jgi:protein tyrosine phosphatase (PTP) superfamily phosphohydrolase (DUF442 family)
MPDRDAALMNARRQLSVRATTENRVRMPGTYPQRFLTFAAALAIACCAALSPASQAADAPPLQAPNIVPISARLVTSGQPTAASLSTLAAQGFGAVIYLAPPTVEDAVPGEADIVRRQGLEFVNIPIEFGDPTDADFQQFVTAMQRFHDRKVLVHCQINMRGSTMTFLYRVIVEHEKPELAYESVSRVWSPRGVWKRLIVSELRKADIAFEPY